MPANRPYLAGTAGLVCLVFALCTPPSLATEEEPERISCFLIGSAVVGVCPLPEYFSEDPLFTYVLDPQQAGLTVEQRQRLDRLYFPRTRSDLLSRFDMIFISDPRLEHWTSRHYDDLNHAFREAGVPCLWAFGPSINFITATTFNEILPIENYNFYFHSPWRVVFHRNRDPVFTPFIEFGMENVQGIGYASMTARQGSVTWADMQPHNFPWMVSWKAGGDDPGITWVLGDEFCVFWWAVTRSARGKNPYGIDMMANLVLYSLDRPLLTDLVTRRESRRLLSGFQGQRLLVISMIEWADRFGANTLSVSEDLADVDSRIWAARELYVLQDYPESISILDAAASDVALLINRAAALKDQALLWIFLLEWLATTSVAMISGFALWTLMIRRRLYRAAVTTRIARRE